MAAPVAGALIAMLPRADANFRGGAYVALVALGTLGALLVVEAVHRGGIERRALAVLGGAAVTVVLLAIVLPAAPAARSAAPHRPKAPGPPTPPAQPLRMSVAATDPGVFAVAFPDDIGVPSDQTGWRELIARGGIDAFDSSLRATFANRSNRPLTITDIHVEVVKSAPAPRGSIAYVHTQGDGTLHQFAVRIGSAAPRSTWAIYGGLRGVAAGWSPAPPAKPFFDEHYISLKPGEIYEATINVLSFVPAAVSYRLVVAGSKADRAFTLRTPGVARITGLRLQGDAPDAPPNYGRTYTAGYLELMHSSGCSSVVVHRWYTVPSGGLPLGCP